MAVKTTTKKPLKGNDRSHALNTHKRARKLNLQVHKLDDGTKVRITAREKRTLRKTEIVNITTKKVKNTRNIVEAA